MELYAIPTPIIRPGDDLVQVLQSAIQKTGLKIRDHDVLVLAETAVATAQNRIRKLSEVQVTSKARNLARQYDLDPAIAQLVLEESEEILGGVSHVVLTIKHNTLMANAGIDQSNAPIGYVVLLPFEPTKEAWRIKESLEARLNCELGVIIADSRTQPLRLGTVGLALATAGIEPVKDFRGQPDLYKRPLRITRAAIADNLASGAQLLFGEADEQIPCVLVRDAPINFTRKRIDPGDYAIPRNECLFFSIFEEWYSKMGDS